MSVRRASSPPCDFASRFLLITAAVRSGRWLRSVSSPPARSRRYDGARCAECVASGKLTFQVRTLAKASYPDKKTSPSIDVVSITVAAHALLTTLLGSAPWITRRVESIDFADGISVVRRTSLDLTPPVDERKVPLPLAFSLKDDTTPISVTDQERRALPVLTRRESAQVAFTALVLTAAAHDVTPTIVEENLLLAITLEPPVQALRAVEELCELRHEWEESKELAEISHLLARETPVMAVIDESLGRQVVHVEVGPSRLQGPSGSRLTKWRSGRGSSFVFPVGLELGSDSYHLQVEAPRGLNITNVRVVGQDARPSARLDLLGSLATVSVEAPMSRRATVVVEVAPRLGAVLSLMVLAASVLSIVVVARLADVRSTSTLSALLVVPGLLAAWISTARDLNGAAPVVLSLRTPAALVGSAAFLGAVGLALGVDTGSRIVLVVAGALAALAASLLASSLPRRVVRRADTGRRTAPGQDAFPQLGHEQDAP
jgi:hypothetical protein